jgi:hypothetical protein
VEDDDDNDDDDGKGGKQGKSINDDSISEHKCIVNSNIIYSNIIYHIKKILTWKNHRLPSSTRITCMGESVSQSLGVPMVGKLYVFSGKRHKPNRFATTRFFYTKIDDHGVRRGDMWRIIAR